MEGRVGESLGQAPRQQDDTEHPKIVKALYCGLTEARRAYFENTKTCQFLQLHMRPCHWFPTSRTRDFRA